MLKVPAATPTHPPSQLPHSLLPATAYVPLSQLEHRAEAVLA